jgi:hypothetical protein
MILVMPALLLVVASASGQAVTLALKFPAGRVDKMSMVTDLNQTMSSPDLPAPVKQFMRQSMGKGTLEGNVGQANISLKADLVEQRGVIWFDLDRGWQSDQAIDQTMKGTVTVTDPNGKQIKLGFDQKLRLESKAAPAK